MTRRILPIGSFFPLDEEGYVVNPCDARHLGEPWRRLLAEAVAIYRERLGDALHSVWVRGSLPRGLLTAGLSDVDTFALVHGETAVHWQTPAWAQEEADCLRTRFPDAGEVELVTSSYQPGLFRHNPRLAMLIATQSLPLAGPDIRPSLPRFRPGPDMLLHYRWLAADLEAFAEAAPYDQAGCRRIAKQLVRVAGELVQERDGRFTPDLYWCLAAFSRYYPEKREALRQVLRYFLNPVAGDPATRDFLLRTGAWLLRELSVNLPAK